MNKKLKILKFKFIRNISILFIFINFGRAALLVDHRRHEAKINFGRGASRPRGLIDMSSF